MSDQPTDQSIEEQQQEVPQEPRKKKRVVSPEQKAKMMENLEKARLARAANRKNVTKYPKAKRERAQQMYQEDIEKKAEERAKQLTKELLEKEKQEQELAEYRKWKASQQTSGSQDRDPGSLSGQSPQESPPVKKKSVTKKASSQPKKAPTSAKGAKTEPAKRKAKPKNPVQYEEDQDESQSYSIQGDYNYSQGGWNIDDFLD